MLHTYLRGMINNAEPVMALLVSKVLTHLCYLLTSEVAESVISCILELREMKDSS